MRPDPLPSFYAIQPRWLRADRLFKVFASSQRLAFAYVAGQIYDQRSAWRLLQQLKLLLFPLVQRWLQKREEREQLYTADNVSTPNFLTLDERNFSIEKRDVSAVVINWRRSVWTPDNIGTVTITRRDTSESRFILLGNQVPDEILGAVREFWPSLETKGTPSSTKGIGLHV